MLLAPIESWRNALLPLFRDISRVRQIVTLIVRPLTKQDIHIFFDITLVPDHLQQLRLLTLPPRSQSTSRNVKKMFAVTRVISSLDLASARIPCRHLVLPQSPYTPKSVIFVSPVSSRPERGVWLSYHLVLLPPRNLSTIATHRRVIQRMVFATAMKASSHPMLFPRSLPGMRDVLIYLYAIHHIKVPKMDGVSFHQVSLSESLSKRKVTIPKSTCRSVQSSQPTPTKGMMIIASHRVLELDFGAAHVQLTS